MKSELIVDVQPQEIAIALTEDDRLQEVSREKRNQDNFAVGNIYYGRGVILFTFNSLLAFPANSSTSAVKYSKIAAV